jgi:hypothetical protein
MPIHVCIVEPQGHPAPGALERLLPPFGDFTLQTTNAVPDPLDGIGVLILNSLPSAPDSLPEDTVLRYVDDGGGLFSIHDTVYPYSANQKFIAACGIRRAYDAVQPIRTDLGVSYQVLLASADPNDPTQVFPVRPMVEGAGHPILTGIREFEIAEEVWAQNLATDARPLMSVDVGDRIPSHPRFKQPIPVCACKTLGRGRLAFFSLGHRAQLYQDPNFIQITRNAILWTSKQTNDSQYAYDLFLSFSSRNKDQAREVYADAIALGLRVFMDEREVAPGEEFSEVIRAALVGSREMALLATTDSMASEWVTTEWGAAWALRRKITPILYRCDTNALPERLRQKQAIDFRGHAAYLEALRKEAQG